MTRVLIVDDNEENLYFVRSLLEAHGDTVDCARNGEEALASARRTLPDVVVSDLLMPVMDGFTLLRCWKADDRLRAVPFLVYTATYVSSEDERLARNLGADAFILKPSDPDVFVQLIREAVTKAAQMAPSMPKDGASTGESSELKLYSEILIRKLEEKALALEASHRALLEDAAERKRLEEQLRQTQKMEAVGQLAGGVAHDFNNLLSVILSYTSLILLEAPQGSLREDVEQVYQAGRRATDLTRQLLAYSRKQMLVPRVLDVGMVISGMRMMLRTLIGEAINLSITTPAACGKIVADPTQLEQIVMNLAVNARDAMPKGGTLSIELTNAEPDSLSAPSQVGGDPVRYVLLTVSDNGEGMDAATEEHIFEPFFTTKGAGDGTGLGLATVFGIVKQSHGHISVKSELGRGTTFKIYFPRTNLPIDELISEPPPQEARGGSETILVVEDDDQVRIATRTILKRSGYQVLDAQNGGEAFLICEKFRGKIDVLLTDVVMPRMSGKELANRLLPMRPDMRVLFVSGYSENAIVHEGVVEPGIAFLQKPLTTEALLKKVRAVINPGGTSDLVGQVTS